MLVREKLYLALLESISLFFARSILHVTCHTKSLSIKYSFQIPANETCDLKRKTFTVKIVKMTQYGSFLSGFFDMKSRKKIEKIAR